MQLLLAQKDSGHYTVYASRRCFLWNNQYFQLDVYGEPCPERCLMFTNSLTVNYHDCGNNCDSKITYDLIRNI